MVQVVVQPEEAEPLQLRVQEWHVVLPRQGPTLAPGAPRRQRHCPSTLFVCEPTLPFGLQPFRAPLQEEEGLVLMMTPPADPHPQGHWPAVESRPLPP